jgi:quinol monooxygenase YgiN
MIKVGLLVQLEAKQGREADLEAFLKGGLELVQNEPATTAWFAIRLGATTFGIFDVFPDEAGRQAHLSGKLAAALMERIPELLSQAPRVDLLEIIETKLPH